MNAAVCKAGCGPTPLNLNVGCFSLLSGVKPDHVHVDIIFTGMKALCERCKMPWSLNIAKPFHHRKLKEIIPDNQLEFS